jgi:hypothetical protein
MFLVATPVMAGSKSQPVPPTLPPIPATVAAPKATSPAAATDDSKSTCVGAKIICECNGPAPKPVVKNVVKTVVKTVTKEVPVEKIVTKEVTVNRVVTQDVMVYPKHNFGLMLGGGPAGVSTQLYDSEYEFKKAYGVVGGAFYQYNVTDTVGLGVAAFSNDSYFGTLSFSK